MNIEKFFDKNQTELILLSNYEEGSPFAHKVVVVVKYDKNLGTVGLCINDPLGLTLSDFDPSIKNKFVDVKMYNGGEVQQNSLTLTCIDYNQYTNNLRWYFCINNESMEYMSDIQPFAIFRGYCGHIEWRQGQLEYELRQRLWLPVTFLSKSVFFIDKKNLWDVLMLQFYAFAMKSTYLPKNPTLN